MKHGYEDGWLVEFEGAAREFLLSDAGQGEATPSTDDNDDLILPKAEPISEEMSKRAGALRSALEDVIEESGMLSIHATGLGKAPGPVLTS